MTPDNDKHASLFSVLSVLETRQIQLGAWQVPFAAHLTLNLNLCKPCDKRNAKFNSQHHGGFISQTNA